ncbi:MAG TPA: hypothetical protein VE860_16365 [Chthoniobacterales bacterium]|nr:hypothetical protein [Chthoniobacterales bacterium]
MFALTYLLQALFERVNLEAALSPTVIERTVVKILKETRTFQKWLEGFGIVERIVYSALSTASEGRLLVEQLKLLLDSRMRSELDDALATLSFHCVIDDSTPEAAEIAGKMFRDWFLNHNPEPRTNPELRNFWRALVLAKNFGVRGCSTD